jgi:hypothetical protein
MLLAESNVGLVEVVECLSFGLSANDSDATTLMPIIDKV